MTNPTADQYDRLAAALANLFSPVQLDDLQAEAWQLSLRGDTHPSAADWATLARGLDLAHRHADMLAQLAAAGRLPHRKQPDQAPAATGPCEYGYPLGGRSPRVEWCELPHGHAGLHIGHRGKPGFTKTGAVRRSDLLAAAEAARVGSDRSQTREGPAERIDTAARERCKRCRVGGYDHSPCNCSAACGYRRCERAGEG